MRRILLLCLCLSACGEPVPNGNDAAAAPTPDNESAPDIVTTEPAPVWIGELGPNFKACSAAGTTRHLGPDERLPVRSAPFEGAPETGGVPAGARFFVCTRSLDQKWFGIVYEEAGSLAARCGVSHPVTTRRPYAGPCAAGWVASPFVKLIAGNDPPGEAKPAASDRERPASKSG